MSGSSSLCFSQPVASFSGRRSDKAGCSSKVPSSMQRRSLLIQIHQRIKPTRSTAMACARSRLSGRPPGRDSELAAARAAVLRVRIGQIFTEKRYALPAH